MTKHNVQTKAGKTHRKRPVMSCVNQSFSTFLSYLPLDKFRKYNLPQPYFTFLASFTSGGCNDLTDANKFLQEMLKRIAGKYVTRIRLNTIKWINL